MVDHMDMDYISFLEDEIALEGLDGITLEGLWLRLSMRPNFLNVLSLDEDSKSFLWTLIIRNCEIFLLKLQSPRKPLKIFNRYELLDPHFGIILEPNVENEDIYPCCPINDDNAGVRGSCSTYYTRIEVTDTASILSYKEVVEMYGDSLILVASQLLRNKALCISGTIDKFSDLTICQYVLLERVGRSRTMGEVTQGKNSLMSLNENPKTMFYLRKRLLRLNLITKQDHRQKSCKGNICASSLLHLTRFYIERKSKFVLMIEKTIEILKEKPMCMCPYEVLKRALGVPDISSKKLFKSAEFQRYAHGINVPYRQIYPDAPESKWKYKVREEEKVIKCLQLIDPDISINDICKDDDEVASEDEEDMNTGILDQSNLVYGVSLLQQSYRLIDQAGPNGLTQNQIACKLGQSKLDSRSICRNLIKRNAVHSFMKDYGRQRITRYVSNAYGGSGHLLQEFEEERTKMVAMVESSGTNGKGEDKNEAIGPMVMSTARVMESDQTEKVEVGIVMVGSGIDDGSNLSTACSPEKQLKFEEIILHKDSSEVANLVAAMEKGGSEPDEENFLSADLMEDIKEMYASVKHNNTHITTRMMKRANMIVREIRNERVIDDLFKLQKMIIESEYEEGFEFRMDKKSLLRLMNKLMLNGIIKQIVIKLKVGSNTKNVQFYAHPDVTTDNAQMKAAIENLKHRFRLSLSGTKSVNQERVKVANIEIDTLSEIIDQEVMGESVKEIRLMNKVPEEKIVNQEIKKPLEKSNPDKTEKKILGAKTSVGPKFVRMQELHLLLFYLVYGYEGSLSLDQEQGWNTILKDNSMNKELLNKDSDLGNLEKRPMLHTTKLGWTMFLPPLPEHKRGPGWIFVVDVLLRLPLCIFVKIVNIAAPNELLGEYLKHPIKKFFRVKSLPPELRTILLHRRRYVSYITELLDRLCSIGLVQNGNQVMKEKDQIFVYLNRRAILIDTTTSDIGYHKISKDKEYVKKEYVFNEMQCVTQYWYDMWTICMHTPLGGHSCIEGKKVMMERLEKKPAIIEYAKPIGIEAARLRDHGFIPGDGRGSAGLDSACFAHLKRNWSHTNRMCIPNAAKVDETGENKMVKAGDFDHKESYAQYLRESCSNDVSLNTTSTPKQRLAGIRTVRLSLYKPPKGSNLDLKPIEVALCNKSTLDKMKEAKVVQKVEKKTETQEKKKSDDRVPKVIRQPTVYHKPRFYEAKPRRKPCKKPYYDEEDKAALRRMSKLRVDWFPAEDSFLLLCKVASNYLFPNKRGQMVSFSIVRDMLHKRYPQSRNKTSRACQRRINYVMKNPATEQNVSIFMAEVCQDPLILRDFDKPDCLPHKFCDLKDPYITTYKQLVERLVLKFGSGETRKCPNIPDTLEEFYQKFNKISPASSLRGGEICKEVEEVSDIQFNVLSSLIFGSLCASQDRESFAFQLYLAYQTYSTKLLDTVLIQMRERQMISYKKQYNKAFLKNCVRLSSCPFQLSLNYIYMFHLKHPYSIFNECWLMTKLLLRSKENAITNSSNESVNLMQCGKRLSSFHNEDEQYHTNKRQKLDSDFQPPSNEILISKEFKSESALDRSGLHSPETDKCSHQKRDKPDFLAEHCTNNKHQKLDLDMEHPGQTNLNDDIESNDSNPLPFTFEGIDESGVTLHATNIGGYCAAVVCLMASKRIIFQIKMPEQIIVLEEDFCSSKINKTSIVQRVEELEKISGRKVSIPGEVIGSDFNEYDERDFSDKNSDSDDESAHDEPEETLPESFDKSESIYKHRNDDKERKFESDKSGFAINDCMDKKCNDDATDQQDLEDINEKISEPISSTTIAESFPTALPETDHSTASHATNSTAVKEFITNKTIRSARPKVDDGGKIKFRSSQMSSSRLSLWFHNEMVNLREVQDYVLVNTCEITCKLKVPEKLKKDNDFRLPSRANLSKVDRVKIPDELFEAFLEIPKQVVNDALDVRKSVVVKHEASFGNVMDNLLSMGRSKAYMDLFTKIYYFIDSHKEFGASMEMIEAACNNDLFIIQVVQELEEFGLTWKVGVVHLKWVTIQYTKPWVIRTNKISRDKYKTILPLRMRGVYELGKEAGTATQPIDTDSGVGKDESSKDESFENNSSNVDIEETPTSQAETETSEIEVTPDSPVGVKRSKRQLLRRKSLDKQKKEDDDDDCEVTNLLRPSKGFLNKKNYKETEAGLRQEKAAMKHFKEAEYEEIDVAVRPWVKLNGCITRRVLDRFLGAVLIFIMERPAIMAKKVADKFWPALQPAHTYELVETLISIGCLTKVCLRASHKVSLFSKPQEFIYEPADSKVLSEEMLLEATVDCTLRLSLFIGDKTYSQDFLSVR